MTELFDRLITEFMECNLHHNRMLVIALMEVLFRKIADFTKKKIQRIQDRGFPRAVWADK